MIRFERTMHARGFLRAAIRGGSAWAALAAFLATASSGLAQGPFVNWENAPVHPLDVSPSEALLAVANLADNRVELFDLDGGVPIPRGRVQVGLDPVTVRFRTEGEVWAVNHVSDSISVVDVATMRVRATIPVGDEPCDVVFVPGSPALAFVSCSQVNELRVLDAVTHEQRAVVPIAGEDPRALAVSPDGSKVYAAIFESGNASTILGGGIDDSNTIAFPPNVVSDPLGPYGGANPPPNVGGPSGGFLPTKNPANGTPPRVGLVVKKNAAGRWMDDNGGDWSALVSGPMADRSGRPVGWDLPDRDLAIVDVATLNVSYARGLMNLCMAVGVNPADGRVHVVGTDATNEVRFEPNVNGRFVHVKLATVNPDGSVAGNVDLNPHLTYEEERIPQEQRDRSLGDPRAIAWNSDGTRGYVAGMGSNNLIAIDASGSRVAGTADSPVELGAGPAGIAVAGSVGRIYVLERFAASVAVLDQATLGLLHRARLFDPTPGAIKIGRRHLYDTHETSGLGQVACASCHVDARMDRLAWDLGDPAGELDPSDNQNDFFGTLGQGIGITPPIDEFFHPMKGPMLTQTLQDIIGKEPHHWRGDRDGLEHFNGAFLGLQGDDENLTPPEMQEYEDFLATIHFPPNPYRNFDNTLPASLPLTGFFKSGRFGGEGDPLPAGSATRGLQIYRRGTGTNNAPLDNGALDCVTCHTLPTGASPNRTAGGNIVQITFNTVPVGPLGERHLGLVAIDGSTQDALKTPQLRNLHERLGFELTAGGGGSNNAGFGYTHDGAVDSIPRFVTEPVFSPADDQDVADLTAFMLSFGGSDLPLGSTTGGIVPRRLEPLGELSKDSHAGTGRQFAATSPAGDPILDAMIAEANEDGSTLARGVDLVVKGLVGGVERGWFLNHTTGNVFLSDRDADGGTSPSVVLALAGPGAELTYTVVPRGSGRRIGIDRDEDGFGDRTEIEACSDPEDASSTPLTGSPELSVDPAQEAGVAFGAAVLGAGPSVARVVTMFNTGPVPLRFKGVGFAITGEGAGAFRIVEAPSPSGVGALQTGAFEVVFEPTELGPANASLTITTNDCDEGIVRVPLSGQGVTTATPSPTASPTPSPTGTASPTPTPLATLPPTASPTPPATASPTATATATATPAATATATATASPTATPTATATATATPTATATATATATTTPTPTATATATASPSPSPTPFPSPTPAGVRLSNLSTRGAVASGAGVMIAGIIVEGTGSRRVLLSGVGPALAEFGVSGVLANPALTLLRGQNVLASNDDWAASAEADAIRDSGRAPTHPLEAAILADLVPGEYTAILAGGGPEPAGVGLVQAFDLGPTPGAEGEVRLGNLSTRMAVGAGDQVLIAGLIVEGTGAKRVLVRGLGPTLGAAPFHVEGAMADPELLVLSGSTVLQSNADWREQSDPNAPPGAAATIEALGLAPPDGREPAILVTLPPGEYTAIVTGAGGSGGVALVEIYEAPE